MLEAKNAEFSFESFKVPRFSFNERNELEGKLKLGFLPSGRYISKTGDFELTLNFTTHDADDKDKVVFELTALAFFKFSSPIDLSLIHI